MTRKAVIQILKKPQAVWKKIYQKKKALLVEEIKNSIQTVALPGQYSEVRVQSWKDVDKMYTLLRHLKIYQSHLYQELEQIRRWYRMVNLVYHYYHRLPTFQQGLLEEVYQKNISKQQLKRIYQLSEKSIDRHVANSIDYINGFVTFLCKNKE